MHFLTTAKQLVWRHGFSTDLEFLAALEDLVLAKLAESGEITDEDRAWARALVCQKFHAEHDPQEPTPSDAPQGASAPESGAFRGSSNAALPHERGDGAGHDSEGSENGSPAPRGRGRRAELSVEE